MQQIGPPAAAESFPYEHQQYGSGDAENCLLMTEIKPRQRPFIGHDETPAGGRQRSNQLSTRSSSAVVTSPVAVKRRMPKNRTSVWNEFPASPIMWPRPAVDA